MQSDLNILLRLMVALVLTGALGWERESTGKAAGVRTHMLVGVGATLFVALGELLILRFRTYGELMRFDPIRVIEAVVTGVSFLGAGIIFVSRGEQRVKGLTTAASIWTASAIGIAVGLERYVLAAGSTIIVFIVLRALRFMDIEPDSSPIKVKEKDLAFGLKEGFNTKVLSE